MGGEVFKRRLVHSVVVTITIYNNFGLLLKSFITAYCASPSENNVCITMHVFLGDEFLLM